MHTRRWLDPVVVQAIDRVEAELERPWSLRDMAQVASFSPFHFHRLFRGAMGETPAALVERLRLERAALMLLAGDAQIIELALDVGYGRPETFARRFRARFQVAARDYRKHQLELWSELELEPGQDPIGEPGDIRVTQLPPLVIEVRRSIGEDDGMSFDLARSPWSDWDLEPSAQRVGALLDWPGITEPGQVRQDWGRVLDGRPVSSGWVRRTIGDGLYATLSSPGGAPVVPTVYQRLFVWSMAGRHRLRPGPIIEIEYGDSIVVHQPVTDTEED